MTIPSRILAVLAAVLVGLVPARAKEATSVRIDPSVTQGVWEGWGTSLCWMGKVFGGRADLADLFFTTKTVALDGESLPGLGLNIVRYNAGASAWREFDGRHMVVSNDILPFRQIDGFWLDPASPDPASASWDWSVDGNQRAMLLMARDRGADRFELFSNSPMWWMCRNDNPSGAPKGEQDNLAPGHYADFAHYLAAVARHARDEWGVSFTSVEPFNEPTSRWWQANGKQEGCHVSVSEQMGILPLVRAALDEQGLQDIPLSASDESLYDEAVATWKGYSPEAKSLVAQVNVHGYQGAGGDRALLHRIVSADGKRLWNSEHGDKDESGLDLARNLHRDFDRLHPTAWCYWQLIDGGRQGRGGSGWGLLDADMNKGRILKTNPKWFVLAQYSRHIRPGMAILGTGDASTVAAYDAAAGVLVLVVLNDGPERSFHFDLSAFRVPDGSVSTALTEPKAHARHERKPGLRVSDGAFTADLPADSIQTFEVNNVSAARP